MKMAQRSQWWPGILSSERRLFEPPILQSASRLMCFPASEALAPGARRFLDQPSLMPQAEQSWICHQDQGSPVSAFFPKQYAKEESHISSTILS